MFAVSEPAAARHVTPKPTIQLVNTQITWPSDPEGAVLGQFHSPRPDADDLPSRPVTLPFSTALPRQRGWSVCANFGLVVEAQEVSSTDGSHTVLHLCAVTFSVHSRRHWLR
jgi:hypothetical protein